MNGPADFKTQREIHRRAKKDKGNVSKANEAITREKRANEHRERFTRCEFPSPDRKSVV